MNNISYFIIALLWMIASAAIGLYVLGKGMTLKQQVTIGIRAMLVSFLIGVSILFVAVVMGF